MDKTNDINDEQSEQQAHTDGFQNAGKLQEPAKGTSKGIPSRKTSKTDTMSDGNKERRSDSQREENKNEADIKKMQVELSNEEWRMESKSVDAGTIEKKKAR